ncbi:hypothetical protein V6R21_11210 [Limibacter armeniacum]|uniref:hypothetical protein n=1 Tax=Limibacter armeniacum TaxID=466084 RepID=UPI002FE62BC3
MVSKKTGGTYTNLFQFDFKPSKTDEGLTILKESLLPAFKKIGVKVTIIEDLMDTKDVLALIELKMDLIITVTKHHHKTYSYLKH